MAHKKIGDKIVVDWVTGDPEGDRITLLAAYRDFIIELEKVIDQSWYSENAANKISDVLEKWNIDTDNQVDDIPRIWIKRPEL